MILYIIELADTILLGNSDLYVDYPAIGALLALSRIAAFLGICLRCDGCVGFLGFPLFF